MRITAGRNALVFALAVAAASSLSAQNLIRNGGFEERNEKGRFANWWHDTKKVTSSEDAFKGVRAAFSRLEKEAGKGPCLEGDLYQTIRGIRPGQYKLVICGKVKGDGSIWASWHFHDAKNQKIKVPLYWSKGIKASAEWQRIETILTVPAGTVKMSLGVRFRLNKGDQSGTGLIDEVSLTPLDSKTSSVVPAGAKLIYSAETFTPGILAKDWRVAGGEWKVVDGALFGRGSNAKIFFSGRIPSPNLRLEYTAWSARPGDLSAYLNGEVARSGQCNGYFFGFGSVNNTENKIARGGKTFVLRGGMWDSLVDGIRPNVRHRVAVQRDYEKLTMAVDGKTVLESADPGFSERLEPAAGFYIWTEGYISDVKLYALPYAGGAPKEKKLEERRALLFNDGKLPGVKATGGTRMELVDIPTFVMKSPARQTLHATQVKPAETGSRRVSDTALKLTGNPRYQADIAFRNLLSGIVELDVFAPAHGEVNFEILDAQGRIVQQLNIHPDGSFHSGTRKLRDRIHFLRRRYDAPLKFEPGRWHTFRLHFNVETGLTEIALRDYYTELKNAGWAEGCSGDSILLGSKMGTPRKSPACLLRISGRGSLFADNAFIFGPLGTAKVNGKEIGRPARELLGVNYPLRRDPIRLRNFRFRHFPDTTSKCNLDYSTHAAWLHLTGNDLKKSVPFRPAGREYNALLLKAAYSAENIALLERRDFYRGVPGASASLKSMHKAIESALEKALTIYADAYWNDWNEKELAALKPQCEKLRRLLAELDAKIAAESGKNAKLVPLPLFPGRLVWNAGTKFWEQNGKPVVWPYTCRLYPGYQEDASMLGLPKVKWLGPHPMRTDSKEPGEYLNRKDGYYGAAGRHPDYDMALCTDGVHYANTVAPPWWIEAHKEDPDIFFCDADGKPIDRIYPPNRSFHLNWFHPAVKKLIRDKYTAVGKQIALHPEQYLYARNPGELKNTLPGGSHPGYNKSAAAEFQRKLQEKYGSITELNRRWKTRYHAFAEIVPPKTSSAPSGLQYEFRKFFHEAFAEWVNSPRTPLREGAGVPLASDQQETFGGHVNIEPVSYFKALDIKLYHTYQAWDRKVVDRWHHQLCSAVGNRFGALEWQSAQGIGEMFEYDAYKTGIRREIFQQLMWGAIMVNPIYHIGFCNWQYNVPIWDPTLDYTLFNDIAGSVAVIHDNLRRFGELALTARTVGPEIGIVECAPSYYNKLPVRATMTMLASALSEASWDYGVFYDSLVMEGKQSLSGLKFIWLPHAGCMSAGFRKTLFDWVKNGGTLVAVGNAPGRLDEYGQRAPDYPLPRQEEKIAWQCTFGKGKVMFLPKPPRNVAEFQAKHREKVFGSENGNLQFRLCGKDGKRYLFAVNWAETPQTAEIFVPGRQTVADAGLPVPEPVKTRFENGKTRFRTRLAPGAGTVFVFTEK